jgi:hypothetical protein
VGCTVFGGCECGELGVETCGGVFGASMGRLYLRIEYSWGVIGLGGAMLVSPRSSVRFVELNVGDLPLEFVPSTAVTDLPFMKYCQQQCDYFNRMTMSCYCRRQESCRR